MSKPIPQNTISYTPIIRNKIAEILPRIIQELYQSYWKSNNYDARLYDAMQAILREIRASSFATIDLEQRLCFSCIAYEDWSVVNDTNTLGISGGATRERVVVPSISHGNSTHETDVLASQSQLVEFLQNEFRSARNQFKHGETQVWTRNILNYDLAIIFACGVSDTVGTNPDSVVGKTIQYGQQTSPTVFSCVFFHCDALERLIGLKTNDLMQYELLSDLLIKTIGRQILPIILDAFRYLERKHSSLPGKVRQYYWNNICMRSGGLKGISSPYSPPWDVCKAKGTGITTATLSLDLRKSTYCMEFAVSNPRFGQWLEKFTAKMRYVAHEHGGVFDKFTGDGALVHFLEAECHAIYNGRHAVDAAVNCAVDMQRVIEVLIDEMRTFLQLDSPKFGVGIAVDVGRAFWATDDINNPVVVGPGVVGACRIGDSAPRLSVRLSNIAYHNLDPTLREKLTGIQRVALTAKEVDSVLGLTCWEYIANPAK